VKSIKTTAQANMKKAESSADATVKQAENVKKEAEKKE